MNPLQPKESPKREGKKYDICPEKYNYNDFIAATEKEKEWMERKNMLEYPDYRKVSESMTLEPGDIKS